jgi:hypothetical protein
MNLFLPIPSPPFGENLKMDKGAESTSVTEWPFPSSQRPNENLKSVKLIQWFCEDMVFCGCNLKKGSYFAE